LDCKAQQDVLSLLCAAQEAEKSKDYEQAIALAETSLEQLGDGRPSLWEVDARHRIASCLLKLHVGTRRCLVELEVAAGILNRLCPNCHDLKAHNLTLAGQYHLLIDRDIEQAHQLLRDGLDIWLGHPVTDSAGMAKTLSLLGDAYCRRGEFESATAALMQAHGIRSRVLGPLSEEALTSWFKLGAVYLEAEDYPRAKSLYETAMVATRSLPRNYSSILHLKNNLAVACVELGEYKQAENLYRQLLAHYSGPGFDRQQLLSTLQNLALLQIRTGQWKQAKLHLDKAFALTQTYFFNQSDVAMLHRDLSYYHQKKGEWSLALLHNQKAIGQFIPTLASSDYRQLPNPNQTKSAEIIPLVKMKGDLLLLAYRDGDMDTSAVELASDCYELSQLLLGQAKDRSDLLGDKMNQNSYGTKIHVKGLEACEILWSRKKDSMYLEKAFDWMEMGKAQLQADDMERMRRASETRIPEQLQKDYRALRKRLAHLSFAIDSLKSMNQSSSNLEREWLEKRDMIQRADALISDLGKMDSRRVSKAKVSLRDVQQSLRPGELLVEYMVSDSSVWIFSCGNHHASLRELKGYPELVNQILDYQTWISAPSPTIGLAKLQSTGHDLWLNLIQPEVSNCPTKPKFIRIVPDGALALLPFDALMVSEQTSSERANELDYAIRHHNIRYATSASLLLLTPSANTLHPQACLGLAWGRSYPNQSNDLTPLPGSEKEILQLAQLLPGSYWVSEKADEGTFKAAAEQFGIIHLALHGISEGNRPKMVFPVAGPGEDGNLWLEELLGMGLRARLAVLSACETSAGNFKPGEGVMSMAKGFGWAGCGAVVTSLWAIDDQATGDLMGRFYFHLGQGNRIDDALRQAKLELLEAENANSLPCYWGAFIVSGDTRQLFERPLEIHRPWMGLAAIGVLGLSAVCTLLAQKGLERFRC
jgi:CHAT domain-containing protein/tetratricopeptide (TPR) repeat protein